VKRGPETFFVTPRGKYVHIPADIVRKIVLCVWCPLFFYLNVIYWSYKKRLKLNIMHFIRQEQS